MREWTHEKDCHWVKTSFVQAMNHYALDNGYRVIKCVLEDTTIEFPPSTVELFRERQISVQMVVRGDWFVLVGNNE